MLVDTTYKIITIANTTIKIGFILCALNWLTIFSVNAIPTKIATWIAYRIITCIHNYTSSTLNLAYSSYPIRK